MRIAVISDVHGNLTALQAVAADLRATSPDLVIQAGDLVGSGGRLREIVDLVTSAGWPSVLGNTDDMLHRPEKIDELAERLPQLEPVWQIIREDIGIAVDSLGRDRLDWLRTLPVRWDDAAMAVMHASPGDVWNAPTDRATDDEFVRAYKPEGRGLIVYGHVHVPFIRRLPGFAVANAGSVGLPYDGDPRASYLVVTNGEPEIRRVDYDIEAEIRDRQTGYRNANWVAKILRSGSYAPPT